MSIKLDGKLMSRLNCYTFEIWRAKIDHLKIVGSKLRIPQGLTLSHKKKKFKGKKICSH